MFVEMLNGIKLMFCPKIHSAFSFTYNKNLKEFIILTQKNERCIMSKRPVEGIHIYLVQKELIF